MNCEEIEKWLTGEERKIYRKVIDYALFHTNTFENKIYDTLEALAQARAEIENQKVIIGNLLNPDNPATMSPSKEYKVKLNLKVKKNDGPYVDEEE